VSQWRRSGQTARAFALQEGLAASTLCWWSSELGRDTRASHGSPAIEPIEISLSAPESAGCVEVTVGGDVVVRCDVGARVDYVASLVRALRAG
jgi:hypothetical protein